MHLFFLLQVSHRRESHQHRVPESRNGVAEGYTEGRAPEVSDTSKRYRSKGRQVLRNESPADDESIDPFESIDPAWRLPVIGQGSRVGGGAARNDAAERQRRRASSRKARAAKPVDEYEYDEDEIDAPLPNFDEMDPKNVNREIRRWLDEQRDAKATAQLRRQDNEVWGIIKWYLVVVAGIMLFAISVQR